MSNSADSFNKKQKLKKYGVFVLMFVIFGVCLWLIFAPSKADKEKQLQTAGINSSIPDPKEDGIFDNKKDAYERELMGTKKDDRMRSLQDYAQVLSDSAFSRNNSDKVANKQEDEVLSSGLNSETQQSAIGSSVSAYNDINKSLSAFYQSVGTDGKEQEMLALEWRLTELERKQDDEAKTKRAMDDQFALMEKSYQMATKYMPNQGQTVTTSEDSEGPDVFGDYSRQTDNGGTTSPSGKKNRNRSKITPVSQMHRPVVSALRQDFTDNDLLSYYSKPRNVNFNTMGAGNESIPDKNTILTCVNETQTLFNGQSVALRLLEPMMIEGNEIPANTLLVGKVNLQGERLDILISTIEYDRMIFPVKLSVFDVDGQKGVNIPGSMDMDALKEMIANTGNNMGTSISVTNNAGSQIAADLTRGVVQGTSQYFSKKIRMVKVTLKAGHKLYLTPDDL